MLSKILFSYIYTYTYTYDTVCIPTHVMLGVGSKFIVGSIEQLWSCPNKNLGLQAEDSSDYSDSYNYYYYHEMDQPQMTKRYDIAGYENISCAEEENIAVLGGLLYCK